MTKRIPTFCDGNFHGFETLKEICRLRRDARELAIFKQEREKADHMVYARFIYDGGGDLVEALLYSGLARTDAEFDKMARMEKHQIYAIHKNR